MDSRKLTRRQALAPLAGIALATVTLAPAAAQESRALTAAQKNHLNTILRNLRASKRHVTSAKLLGGDTRRLGAAVDSLIGDVERVLKSGRTTG